VSSVEETWLELISGIRLEAPGPISRSGGERGNGVPTAIPPRTSESGSMYRYPTETNLVATGRYPLWLVMLWARDDDVAEGSN
jgi:hypothetical protein